jgi:hypothetical protein
VRERKANSTEFRPEQVFDRKSWCVPGKLARLPWGTTSRPVAPVFEGRLWVERPSEIGDNRLILAVGCNPDGRGQLPPRRGIAGAACSAGRARSAPIKSQLAYKLEFLIELVYKPDLLLD